MFLNLFKPYFLSFYFSSQSNKKVLHPFTFLPFQLNTNEGNLNLFYLPKNSEKKSVFSFFEFFFLVLKTHFRSSNHTKSKSLFYQINFVYKINPVQAT